MRFRHGILSRYLIKSFLGPFLAGFLFFTFIILIFYLKDVIKSAIEKGLPFEIVGQLFIYALGWTLSLTIPMAVLMATLMSVGALNADSEIIAMRAGGMTYSQIFRPFIMIGVLITGFMVWFNLDVNPYCMRQMRVVVETIFHFDPTAVIEPGQFTLLDRHENTERHIYIEKIKRYNGKKPDRLYNIQIRSIMRDYYSRLAQLVIAKEGIKIMKQLPNGVKVKALRLYKGYIFNSNQKEKSFQRIDFMQGSMDLNIVESKDEKSVIKITNPQAMSLSELSTKITESANFQNETQKNVYLEYVIERHKRYALPFASLAFIFLGFPLAIVNRRSGKGIGFGISIIFIFAYYVVFLSTDSLSMKVKFPPIIAAWNANIICFVGSGYLFMKRTGEYTWNDVLLILKNKFFQK